MVCILQECHSFERTPFLFMANLCKNNYVDSNLKGETFPNISSDCCTMVLNRRHCVPPLRLAWWRTSARIQVRRQSHSSTSSSAAPVQRVTASTPLDSPTCPRRSSSQATEKPESLRGAPSASDSSSKFCYILWLPSYSPHCKALTLTLCLPLQEDLPVRRRCFPWRRTLCFTCSDAQ